MYANVITMQLQCPCLLDVRAPDSIPARRPDNDVTGVFGEGVLSVRMTGLLETS